MAIRKKLTRKKRLEALGYGAISIAIALLIALFATFEWSGAIAFIIGLFGFGGVYRCIVAYDQI
ncbi:MAG: hypothetical protein AAFQ04_01685 [Pseudomonadota bacterium]